MQVERMTRQDEKRLVALEAQVVDAVRLGENPTKALEKIARENRLSPDEIRRIGEIYNVARSLAAFEKASEHDRIAEFTLVDQDTVIESIYTNPPNDVLSRVKSAVSQWAAPAGMDLYQSQTVSAPVQDHEAVFEVARRDMTVTKAACADAARSLAKSRVDLDVAIGRLEAAIDGNRKIAAKSLCRAAAKVAPPEYREWAWKAALDLARRSRLEGVESLSEVMAYDPSSVTLVDLSPQTFASLERMVQAAVDHGRKAAEAESLRTQQVKAAESLLKAAEAAGKELPVGLVPRDLVKASTVEPENPLIKSAFGFGLTGNVVNFIKDIPKRGPNGETLDRDIAEAIAEINDPDIRDLRRQIRVRTMLHDLMANDEFISGYDPEEVIDAYNQLIEIAPNIADKEVLMRGLLRRALSQGEIEPFEVGQVLGMEQNLSKAEQGKALPDVAMGGGAPIAKSMGGSTMDTGTLSSLVSLGGAISDPSKKTERKDEPKFFSGKPWRTPQDKAKLKEEFAAERADFKSKYKKDTDELLAKLEAERDKLLALQSSAGGSSGGGVGTGTGSAGGKGTAKSKAFASGYGSGT